ncbi:hypothetical protein [Phytoactinopolyspora mesophila]|uniref:Uncharacterized protein n=1 Tax=Phytoactinopolyspora mesophila TaxID=2650750 RepID=A0A7K3MA29_9ACTN|nr:hypothetical protein [Phytoactinopolyspora mesophila]NDL60159.1 hypothetical protein [Phytoactinopolyspora mesophila]
MHDQEGAAAEPGNRRVQRGRMVRSGSGMPVFVAAALAALLLSGCAGGDDSAAAPTPTSTPQDTATPEPTPTPETTAEPTVDPTEALEAEITEFFEEYIDLVNESWTSEEALVRSRDYFSETCMSCAAVYELAERVHKDALTYEGDLGTLDGVELLTVNGNVVIFVATTSSADARLLNEDGVSVQRFESTQELQVIYHAVDDAPNGWVLIKDEVLP